VKTQDLEGRCTPLDVALGRGVLFCGVGGKALIFGMSFVEVGVEAEEGVVCGIGFFGVVSFLDCETLLVPFVLASDALNRGRLVVAFPEAGGGTTVTERVVETAEVAFRCTPPELVCLKSSFFFL